MWPVCLTEQQCESWYLCKTGEGICSLLLPWACQMAITFLYSKTERQVIISFPAMPSEVLSQMSVKRLSVCGSQSGRFVSPAACPECSDANPHWKQGQKPASPLVTYQIRNFWSPLTWFSCQMSQILHQLLLCSPPTHWALSRSVHCIEFYSKYLIQLLWKTIWWTFAVIAIILYKQIYFKCVFTPYSRLIHWTKCLDWISHQQPISC